MDTWWSTARGGRSPERRNPRVSRGFDHSGGGIRTRDLRVMSPTSYLTAPPRDAVYEPTKLAPSVNPWSRLRRRARPRRRSGLAGARGAAAAGGLAGGRQDLLGWGIVARVLRHVGPGDNSVRGHDHGA